MAGITQTVRFALFLHWKRRCVWCGEPIFFNEMEIDHVVPKSLKGAELGEVLDALGLPQDFDLWALPNLIPSCRPCNGFKGKRPAPAAPIVALVFERARSSAPEVLKIADDLTAKRAIEEALAVVTATAEAGALRDEDKRRLAAALEEVAPALQAVSIEAGDVRLHKAMSLLHNPDGRWHVLKEVSPEVALVSDGVVGGYIGTHPTYVCSQCGSNGPWDGVICRTCGNREQPD